MTDEQIAEARRLRALGMSLSKIGRKLGANYMAVWRVVNDVPLPAPTTKAANYWPQVRIRAEIRHRNGRWSARWSADGVVQNEIVNRSISADSLESVMDELKRETRAMASPLRLWQVRASSREEGPHVYKQPQVAGVR